MKIFFLGLILFALTGCRKYSVSIDKVISEINLSDKVVLSDGSMVDVKATLNSQASLDRRNIIFKASKGEFVGGTNGTITVQAQFENNALFAKAKLIIPSSPGQLIVFVKPEIDDRGDYTIYETISILKSDAKSIQLIPSSFGIESNFVEENELTAILKNEHGNKVSSGTQVLFEDFFISGEQAGGKFRKTRNVTDPSSTVSTLYSIRSLDVGTTVTIKATVLDENGHKTNIIDSIIFTIKK